jgi:histidinol-phosphate aminotransferase
MIDETYCLFAESPEHRLSFLTKFPHLILIRGFSKYGLPGVGVGYFLTHHETAERFLGARVRSMISAAQAAIAVTLFENYTELKILTAKLAGQKKRIGKRISLETDHSPLPGSCDFLLIKAFGGDADALAQKLRAANFPAISYAKVIGFEHIIKLFPAAYSDGDRLIEVFAS